MEKVIHIEGMHCGHCTAAVEKALRALPGVESAVADLEKKEARVKAAALSLRTHGAFCRGLSTLMERPLRFSCIIFRPAPAPL